MQTIFCFFRRAVFFLLLFQTICSCKQLGEARDWAFDFIIDFVPFAVDESLGKASLKEVLKTYPLTKSKDYEKEMITLLKPLIEEAKKVVPGGVDLYLVDHPIINAFAIPGGPIILTTGFVQFVEHPLEIMAVFAHEIAHIAKRHSTKRVIGKLGLVIALQVILGDASELVQIATLQGSKLLTLKNSRDAEREADILGLELMHAANLEQYGFASFFRRLKKKNQHQSGGALMNSIQGLFSTHPMSADRLKYLEKLEISSPSPSLAHFSNTRLQNLKEMARKLQTLPSQ